MSQKIGYERRRKGEIVCWTGGEVGEMWYVANEQMDSGRAVGGWVWLALRYMLLLEEDRLAGLLF